MDGAFGLRVRAGQYREEQALSDVVASRDLRRLVDENLLVPHGEKRGRFYTGTEDLIALGRAAKSTGRAENPYEIVRKAREAATSPELPL